MLTAGPTSLPIAPEFAEFLLTSTETDRNGFVFNPLARRVKGPRLQPHRVGEIVSDNGKAAVVKVHANPNTGKVKLGGKAAWTLIRLETKWAVRRYEITS